MALWWDQFWQDHPFHRSWTVIQLSLEVGLHSFLELPAVGFKACRCQIQNTNRIPYHLTTGIPKQSLHGVDLNPLDRLYTIQSRTNQVEAWGVSVGEILLSTLTFAECVFEMEVLKLTAHQCTCIRLDHVICCMTRVSRQNKLCYHVAFI